jgi:hypothetical protein
MLDVEKATIAAQAIAINNLEMQIVKLKLDLGYFKTLAKELQDDRKTFTRGN